MNLFSSLTHALSTGDRLLFSIESISAEKLSVLVVPQLDAEYESDSDEIAQFRAALSVPLRVVGTPDELDREFFGQLTRYQQARSKVSSELDAVFKINEAAKQAKATPTKSSPTADTEQPATSTVPEPSSMVGASNPDSLV